MFWTNCKAASFKVIYMFPSNLKNVVHFSAIAAPLCLHALFLSIGKNQIRFKILTFSFIWTLNIAAWFIYTCTTCFLNKTTMFAQYPVTTFRTRGSPSDNVFCYSEYNYHVCFRLYSVFSVVLKWKWPSSILVFPLYFRKDLRPHYMSKHASHDHSCTFKCKQEVGCSQTSWYNNEHDPASYIKGPASF